MYPLLDLCDEMLSFDEYTHIDVCVSAGNDSSAMMLHLLHHHKVPKEKITMVHFRIDGPPKNPVFFDWEQTESHLNYLKEYFEVPLVTIWDQIGLKGRIEARGMFPDAKNRFCTSYGKRDVYSQYVRRRNNAKVLCCSGELHSESPRRSRYPVFELHPAHAVKRLDRLVHTFRPILHFNKLMVQSIMKEYGVKQHECYRYVSRCSCKFCIFLSKEEMNRVAKLYPDEFQELKNMERRMGHTMKYIKDRQVPLCAFIDEGSPYEKLELFEV